MEKKWLVFYTKSRQEKKVNELLVRRGYQPFLPLQTQLRQWSDRKKKVTVPLFNGYIFVHAFEHEVTNIVELPGVAWAIRYNGRPAILHETELQAIQRFLATGRWLEATGSLEQFELGEPVKIVDGPLKGMFGRLIQQQNGDRFGMQLESIGQVITIEINRSAIRKLTDNEIDKAGLLIDF